MNFLSIDCSTNISSLFLKFENKSFFKSLQRTNFSNDLLMKQILEFLKENNLDLKNISDIFVNQGPGSFSGLRGSISTAKGISIAKKINLFGYSTFLLSWVEFYNYSKPICCILKFNEKYFFQKFTNNKNFKIEPKIATCDEIIKNFEKSLIIIAENNKKDFDNRLLKLENAHIVKLDPNKLEFLKNMNLLEKKLIRPVYLS
tara:strand:+ start:180 stop:785 length:606 start_codon:yes stop_codon:yes gene_type:complete